MENSQKIKLFGSRDFSGNFDMTLTFLKQNYGKIIKGIAILIPALLILVFFMPNTNRMTSNVYNYSDVFDSYAAMFTLGAITVYFLSAIITYVIFLYTVSYIALYAKSPDGEVKSSDVWSKLANAFLPMAGGTIIFVILVSIGSLLCIIPGIIIYVYLGFYLYVYVNEDRTIIDSFYRSYEIVTNNWWITFGYGLVFILLLIIGRIIFAVPSLIAGIGIGLQIDFLSSDIFVYIVTLISAIGDLLLYPILYIAMGVMYYSHRNKIERVDMETEIDNLGTPSNEQNNQF